MTSNARPSNRRCTSSCGDIRNINYPFRLKSDPKGCGISNYELTCEDNRTFLYIHDGRYYVQSIDYSVSEIRLVDDGLQKDNSSSLPRHSFVWEIINSGQISSRTIKGGSYYFIDGAALVMVNCSKPVSSLFYIDTSSRIKGSSSSNTTSNWNLYVLVSPKALDVRDFCIISGWTWVSHDFEPYKQINVSSYNYELIHNIMADGFTLSFSRIPKKTSYCYFDFYGYFHLRNYFHSDRFHLYSLYGGQGNS
ncbi:uncharacterized protein LOC108953864 [Eucalyptus grandis]|uniref:uncharacterized protein LOC108953864 n=1 Tax=Eucalyptus grandis TaxID=71139 RepID=UPI00192E941A|nr:uncharacterized protein LOC108953864 [Eucalyptus grandis]